VLFGLLLAAAAVASLIMVRIWGQPNVSSHAVLTVLWAIQFAILATAASVTVRASRGQVVTAVHAVVTLTLWTLTPASLVLAYVAAILVSPFLALVVVLPLAAGIAARILVARAQPVPAVVVLLVPVLLIAGVAIDRPVASGSVAWLVVVGWQILLAVAAVAALAWDRERADHAPSGHAG
jgi:hypothetical protein